MVVGLAFDLAAAGLITAMDKLKDTLRDTIDFTLRAEKASLALGQTFEQTNNKLGGTMQGLRGDLNERFAAGIAGMEAGLQGNTAGVARLINQQRLTGTQSKKTALAFAKMETMLGTSREATNNLALDFKEIGGEWMISTDHLVDVLSTLEKSFPAQKLAGMGAEVAEAFGTLKGELGVSMAGPLENVMRAVMDTSQEGFESLVKLGIGGVREQLAAANSAAEATQILKDAINTAAKTTKDFAGGSDKFFRMVGVTTDTFGKASLDIMMVSDAFGERVKQEGFQSEEFGNQLSVIKDEVLLPLKLAFVEFFPIIKDVGIIFGTFLKEKVLLLTNKLVEIFIDMGGFTGIIDTIKKKFKAFEKEVGSISKIMNTVLGVAFLALAAKITWMIAATVLPLIASFTILIAEAIALAVPFLPLIAIIVGVVWIIKKLNDHFGFMDPIIDAVTGAFERVIIGLGEFLISMGEITGVPDILIEWGAKLKGSVEGGDRSIKKGEEVSTSVKDRKREMTEEERFRESQAALKHQLNLDREALGLTRSIDDGTKKIVELATPKESRSAYLDHTANMIGRNIEGLLGIGKDTRSEETLDEMRRLRDLAELTYEAELAKDSTPPTLTSGSE